MYAFDFGKGLVSSFERTSDDGIVVSNRDETGFVDARCQINTVIQHGMEESLEAIGVAFHDFLEYCLWKEVETGDFYRIFEKFGDEQGDCG